MSWTSVYVRAIACPMEAEVGDDVVVEVRGRVEADPMRPGGLRLVAAAVSGQTAAGPAFPPIPAEARWDGGAGAKC